jgi:hypothetical protein
VRTREEAEHLLAELLQAGAIPAIEADWLRIDAPPGILTADRRERLAGCLPELRTLVATRWRSPEECVAHRPCRRMSPCAQPVDGRPCLLPATCSICRSALPPGRRYLCFACSDERGAMAIAPTIQGDHP